MEAPQAPAPDQAKHQHDEDVSIYLNETPTVFVFDQQSSVVQSADTDAEPIKKENDDYRTYLSTSSNSENLVQRGNYTFHLFTKEKEAQTTPILRADEEIQLDFHDLSEVPKPKHAIDLETPLSMLHDSCHPLASHHWSATPESALKDGGAKIDFGPNSEESDAIMSQMKNIGYSLFVVERMVQQNIHLEKLLNYSNTKSTAEQPGAECLLKFICKFTDDRPITDLSFNTQSTNFFAASYGAIGDADLSKHDPNPPKGLICVWNILNPGHPERIIETTSVPTTIVFSEGVPYLLAAGFGDGSVGLYDIRTKKCDCIAMSTVENGSHEGSVGEAIFQQRTDTRVRSEAIVTVAAGGRVTQWTVANGLEHKDLVTLKKLKTVGKEGETQTLRYEDLHCVSFSPTQPNIYVVGSEDGALFVCDAQYNEDFVQKLLFHFRSVLALKFSPMAAGYFLSASCDGSAAMWNIKRQTPAAVFYLTKASFNDIDWSPISSTVFAAACSDGECRIWDVSLDSVDPVARLAPDKKEYTAINWSKNLPVFVAGNTAGVVSLVKVVGLTSLSSGRTKEEEQHRFNTVIQTMSNQE